MPGKFSEPFLLENVNLGLFHNITCCWFPVGTGILCGISVVTQEDCSFSRKMSLKFGHRVTKAGEKKNKWPSGYR